VEGVVKWPEIRLVPNPLQLKTIIFLYDFSSHLAGKLDKALSSCENPNFPVRTWKDKTSKPFQEIICREKN